LICRIIAVFGKLFEKLAKNRNDWPENLPAGRQAQKIKVLS